MEKVSSLNELIDKVSRLASQDARIEGAFKIEIYVLAQGYVVKHTEGSSVFNMNYQPTCEAIERESALMKRIGEIIANKRGIGDSK